MKTKLKLSVLLAIEFAVFGPAHAQTTAFTYNGRLTDNGAPVNGNFDLRFVIYDSEAGNVIVAGPLTNAPVDVANGSFTVRLDFGASVFTGPARWLEVSVRRVGGPNYDTLSPRQELTSSPYAIRAVNAGTATDVANGSVVKSLNSLRDNVTLAAGANVTLTPSGNTLTIAASGTGGGGIWSLNGGSAYYNGGSVGIGTDSPRGALQLASGGLAVTGASSPYTGATNGIFMESGVNGGFLFAFDYASFSPKPLLLNSPGGNVGIGTITPGSRLTVFSPQAGIEHTDGNVRLGTYLTSTLGMLGTVSDHKLGFFIANGGPRMTVDTSGNVGVGTTIPVTRFTVAGVGAFNSLGAAAITLENGSATGRRWEWHALDNGKMQLADYTLAATRLLIDTAGNVGIGTDTPQAKLDVDGTTRTKVLTITGGADLAEPFPFSSANIAQGSVVVIDAEQPGRLKRSVHAYDTRVAGIVSGANGVNPGISLHQSGTLDGSQNVSLTGRVYVLADATTGSINPGDLLTTSDTPGHAMKVADHARAQGAILGKAMSGLKDGKGMVLVLVTLQ